MKELSFHCPTRVVMGEGCASQAAELAPCRTVVVCSEGQRARLEARDEAWAPEEVVGFVDVRSNPDLDDLEAVCDALRDARVERVLAIGGGSAMDIGKAVAAVLGTGGRLASWLRDGEPVPEEGWLPVVAVPTTSGTGSEVTPYAVVWDHAQGVKRGLASAAAFPQLALVDPVLTWGLPRTATLSSGLDAMNQALESVWNRAASEVTVGLAARAVRRAWDALPTALAMADDPQAAGGAAARAAMAEAGVLGGVCIAQTRTALCHAISYPLTLRFGTPHGLACAFSMAAVWEACLREDDGRLARLVEQAGLGDAGDFAHRLRIWLEALGLPRALRETIPAGEPERVVALRGEMFAPGRAENLMVPVTDELVAEVVERSLADLG